MQTFGLDLCVNNSYSGSRVSGDRFPAASSERRIKELCREECYPDLILIYIGFNDFAYGVPIGERGTGNRCNPDMKSFSGAYEQMILRIKRYYPSVNIVAATLMRTFIKEKGSWTFPESYSGIAFDLYNEVIRDVCKKHGIYLADLDRLNYRYETHDGAHPTRGGHKMIANAWIHYLREYRFLQELSKNR